MRDLVFMRKMNSAGNCGLTVPKKFMVENNIDCTLIYRVSGDRDRIVFERVEFKWEAVTMKIPLSYKLVTVACIDLEHMDVKSTGCRTMLFRVFWTVKQWKIIIYIIIKIEWTGMINMMKIINVREIEDFVAELNGYLNFEEMCDAFDEAYDEDMEEFMEKYEKDPEFYLKRWFKWTQ